MKKTGIETSEFISPEHLRASFDRLGGKKSVTQGQFEGVYECNARDSEWNHLDQLHRPYIHRTYQQALRIVRTCESALSLTTVKFAGIPFLVLVSDVQLKQGVYYQSFTLLGLIYVHIMIEKIPEGIARSRLRVNWYIVSNPWFKFLHAYIDRAYRGLSIQQNEEDKAVLLRREEIRGKGYHFASDHEALNFINSNTLTSNVLFPPLNESKRIPLQSLDPSALNQVTVGPVTFLVRFNPDQSISVWTEVCPHEGGPLGEGKLCGESIECPWHGLKFKGIRLSTENPDKFLENYSFRLEGNALTIEDR